MHEGLNAKSGSKERVDTTLQHWSPDASVVESVKDIPGYESLRNKLFERLMKQHIIDLFVEEAKDIGFTDEDIRAAQSELSRYSDDEILGALSLPHELREKVLVKNLADLQAGKMTPSSFINHLVQLGKKYGFTIGYHTSPHDIKPAANGAWVIRGTEKDHRDNDIAMAYYSKKYRHLFKQKSPQYIYVVRGERDHRTDGNWNRAPSLSVVTKLPFAQIHEYVEREARQLESEHKINPQDE